MLACSQCGKAHDELECELVDRHDCTACGGGLVYPDELIHGRDVAKMEKRPRIKASIQVEVDEYIELDAQLKKLQAELKKKRAIIEPYMEERGLQVIKGTHRGSISLEPKNMAIINSRYTTYDVNKIEPLLSPKARRECIVKAVDKDMLELMVKTGQVSESVYQLKQYKPTKAFTINHK